MNTATLPESACVARVEDSLRPDATLAEYRCERASHARRTFLRAFLSIIFRV